jgi:hypothetical protein
MTMIMPPPPLPTELDRLRGQYETLLAKYLDAVAEVERLKGIVIGLADRVAKQSELLTRSAEKRGSIPNR